MDLLASSGAGFSAWETWSAPAATKKVWPRFVGLVAGLAKARGDLPGQVHRVRTFYQPILEDLYDNPRPRAKDLEQLEQIAARYRDRQTMLAEVALDPPSSTQDLTGPPTRDDDYLVLSTIHSAKGLEWDAVYVIHASDGNIPSDMAAGSTEEIEEELRLFYVALTRAKRWLYVTWPLRYFRYPGSFSDSHGYAQLTRFLPERAARLFRRMTTEEPGRRGAGRGTLAGPRRTSRSVRKQTKRFWS